MLVARTADYLVPTAGTAEVRAFVAPPPPRTVSRARADICTACSLTLLLVRCVCVDAAGCPQVAESCVPEPPRCDTHPGSSDGTYLDAGGATLW